MVRRLMFAIAAAWGAAFLALSHLASAAELPPPIGPAEPKVEPVYGDDKLYHQTWFVESFLDLAEDFKDAAAKGKRFAVIFEQRGCSYCIKMHKEVLALRYINDYVRENFAVVQLNLWGDREVIDFDGQKLKEKYLAERWGVIHTPTIFFFPPSLEGKEGKPGHEIAVTRTFGALGPGSFYDMFVWVRHEIYLKDKNFQRFHNARYREREALAGQKDKAPRTN